MSCSVRSSFAIKFCSTYPYAGIYLPFISKRLIKKLKSTTLLFETRNGNLEDIR